jgi:hypothetical protein
MTVAETPSAMPYPGASSPPISPVQKAHECEDRQPRRSRSPLALTRFWLPFMSSHQEAASERPAGHLDRAWPGTGPDTSLK